MQWLNGVFLKQILDDIDYHRIRIFRPPVYENEDEETAAENEEILVRALDNPTSIDPART